MIEKQESASEPNTPQIALSRIEQQIFYETLVKKILEYLDKRVAKIYEMRCGLGFGGEGFVEQPGLFSATITVLPDAALLRLTTSGLFLTVDKNYSQGLNQLNAEPRIVITWQPENNLAAIAAIMYELGVCS